MLCENKEECERMNMTKPEVKTINISLSAGDLADIDTYCDLHTLTRSKFFVQAALEKVQVEHLSNSLILLTGYMDKLERVSEGKIKFDKETMDDMRAMVNILKKEWTEDGE